MVNCKNLTNSQSLAVLQNYCKKKIIQLHDKYESKLNFIETKNYINSIFV